MCKSRFQKVWHCTLETEGYIHNRCINKNREVTKRKRSAEKNEITDELIANLTYYFGVNVKQAVGTNPESMRNTIFYSFLSL